MINIALIGEHNPSVTAHRAIPRALEISSDALSCEIEHQWIDTPALDRDADITLAEYDGVWCVPASPYRSMEGALRGIRYARQSGTPFLGTCGGYQHAALEFSRNVLGYAKAGNSEVDPDTEIPLISEMVCALREESGRIYLNDGSALRKIYAASAIEEEYNCGYGVNAEYLSIFQGSDMIFSGYDGDNEPRALELTNHPFFIGTAFQPERSSLEQATHPLILAFLMAAGVRAAEQSRK